MKVPCLVLKCDPEFVVCQFQRQSACGSCPHADKCSTSTISRLFLNPKEAQNIIKIPNYKQYSLKPNQIIFVEISDQNIIRISLVVYLVSVLVAILLAFLVNSIQPYELVSFVTFIMSIIISLKIINFIKLKLLIKTIELTLACE